MAPRKGSRAAGATRAGGYHVKTGCITCKIRHVKCDEARPECNKCTSTGRKCDGYTLKKDLPAAPSVEQQGSTTWKVSCSHRSLNLLGPTAWKGTIEELQGFDYFRVQTSEDLAYSLNSSLEVLVLQTSQHHAAIKHAAIALGALGHTIRINSASPADLPLASWRHQFAYRQYYKAVKLLQRDMGRDDKDSVNFALIACFLFIVFEFLQGNDPSAITHLRCGLNIIRQQRCLLLNSTTHDQKPPSAMRFDPIQSQIVRIFGIIDSQTSMWLNQRSTNPKSYIPVDSLETQSWFPDTYSSLDDACQDLNDIISRVYNFRRRAAKHDFAHSTAQVPSSVYAERDSFLDELDAHRRRLAIYLTDRQSHGHDPEDPHRITLLRINRKVTTIMLTTYLEPHESSFYARAQPHFWQIVSLATLILRPEDPEMRRKVLFLGVDHSNNKTNSSLTPLSDDNESGELKKEKEKPPHHHHRQIFSFFAGLIQPLYFTAIKCLDRETALKAIELLEMEPWREGSWDSAVMAKTARIRFMEARRWRRWPTEGDGTTVVSGMKDEKDDDGERERLSIEWPLATDPLITYPVWSSSP
ncbi:MAG: hypothetical protein Q9219_005570 [cf. Caloplaca sp. 3 TL-2023]